MGLISSIAKKAAVGSVTAAFPPARWLLTALAWVETALVWWFGNLTRVLVTLVILLMLFCWHLDSLVVTRDDQAKAKDAQVASEQKEARAIALAALNHQQAISSQNAQQQQGQYETQLASARDAANKYIAGHSISSYFKLQPAGGKNSASGTAAGAPSDSSALPPGLSANSIVVPANDVQACTDATTYALKAHDWAATVNIVK